MHLLGWPLRCTFNGAIGIVRHIVAHQGASVGGTVIADGEPVVRADNTHIKINHAVAGGIGSGCTDTVSIVADGAGDAIGVHVVLVAAP